MRKSTGVSVFALLFLGTVVYLWANPATFPIFFGKTGEAEGYAYSITPQRTRHGFYPTVYYVFEKEGRVYSGKRSLTRRSSIPGIGDQVIIKYALKNPAKNKMISFYESPSEPLKHFYARGEGWVHRLTRQKSVWLLNEYDGRGNSLSYTEGIGMISGDTLIVRPFVKDHDFELLLPLQYVFSTDSLNREILTELSTGNVYR